MTKKQTKRKPRTRNIPASKIDAPPEREDLSMAMVLGTAIVGMGLGLVALGAAIVKGEESA